MRVNKIRLLVEILFLVLLARLFQLQALKGEFYRSLSSRNCIRVIPFEGLRGRIFDRNQKVIVDNQPSYNVAVIPREFGQSQDTVVKLASLLGKSAGRINKIIKKDFISSFTPIVVARDVDKRTAINVEERKFSLPGVIVQVVSKRGYPYGQAASHITGYLGKLDYWRSNRLKEYGYKGDELAGFSGVEEVYEQFLRAVSGGTQIQVDHRGRLNKVISFRPASSGQDIYLTIDIRIQKIVEDVFGDKAGSAVLMEPDTGRIVALVSSPSFYSGAFVEEGYSGYVNGLLSSRLSPLFNRAISGQYPLGSVFKAITAAAALENKKITPDKRFYCPGKAVVGNKEFNCWSLHHSQNLIEAIAHSCNVYFYQTGLLSGPDKLSEFALKFGLGRPAGIDLPYETAGFVPSRALRRMQFKSWYDGDTANFSIGQGDLLVSPLQAARLMAVFASSGRLVKPYIVERIGERLIKPPGGVNLGLKQETLDTVIEGLKAVVNSPTGTANIGEWQGFKIAGKTGTAQVSSKPAHGWFAGFLPFDRPRLAFCIFLENGGAGSHAVVLAHQIFSRLKEEGLL